METPRIEEKSQTEEWGAWKFVSEMLDNPDELGIYQTSKCYEQIHDFVVEQKKKAHQAGIDEAVEVVKGYLTETTDVRITKAQLAKALLTLTNQSTTK